MNISSRTPVAWLKSQRPESRRPWHGSAALATPQEPTAPVEAEGKPAAPKRAPVLPSNVLVSTLLD